MFPYERKPKRFFVDLNVKELFKANFIFDRIINIIQHIIAIYF
jgi:hypothetical protein